jgi:flagellar biosynthesis GTPase FlhF
LIISGPDAEQRARKSGVYAMGATVGGKKTTTAELAVRFRFPKITIVCLFYFIFL